MYAIGAGAAMFEGNYENIDIAYKLLAAMGLYEGGDTKVDKISVTTKAGAGQETVSKEISQESVSSENIQENSESSEASEESSADSSEAESSEVETAQESSEESSEEAAE